MCYRRTVSRRPRRWIAWSPAPRRLAATILSPKQDTAHSTDPGGTSLTYNQVVLPDHPVGFWNVDAHRRGRTGSHRRRDLGYLSQPRPSFLRHYAERRSRRRIRRSPTICVNPIAGQSAKTRTHDRGGVDRTDGAPIPEQQCERLCELLRHMLRLCAKLRMARSHVQCETRNRDRPVQSRERLCAFNLSGGKGSGADWQPFCDLFHPNESLFVVVEYTTLSQRADCLDTANDPEESRSGQRNSLGFHCAWQHPCMS
jgi:hypothetical protein